MENVSDALQHIVPGQPGWIVGLLIVTTFVAVALARRFAGAVSWLAWAKTDVGGYGLMVAFSYLGVLLATIAQGETVTWSLAWQGLQQTALFALTFLGGKKTGLIKKNAPTP